MKPFLRQQLERFVERLAELEFLLTRPDIMADMAQFLSLSREHARVSSLVARYRKWQAADADLSAALEMKADAANDDDMLAMAEAEITSNTATCAQLEDQLQRALLPPDPDDERNAFIEVRAGTGGDESALFAGELLRAYTRWCERQGWQINVVSESASDLGGIKEAVLRIDGGGRVNEDGVGVYGLLRFESGGHRVQRVPVTESQGRIHTSACTVAVLPEPDEAAAVQINPAELRIDTYRASGAGGQHVNKTDSAVRVTHLPTGIVAECQDDRSQHRNKARALQVLLARLQERERSERAAKEAATRRGLVGSGDRSDRIRTYNFPQGRLTDHRINLTLYKLQMVMEGDLGDVVTALRHAHEAELVAALEAAST